MFIIFRLFKNKHDYDNIKASKYDLLSKDITLRYPIKVATYSSGIQQLKGSAALLKVRGQMLPINAHCLKSIAASSQGLLIPPLSRKPRTSHQM